MGGEQKNKRDFLLTHQLLSLLPRCENLACLSCCLLCAPFVCSVRCSFFILPFWGEFRRTSGTFSSCSSSRRVRWSSPSLSPSPVSGLLFLHLFLHSPDHWVLFWWFMVTQTVSCPRLLRFLCHYASYCCGAGIYYLEGAPQLLEDWLGFIVTEAVSCPRLLRLLCHYAIYCLVQEYTTWRGHRSCWGTGWGSW